METVFHNIFKYILQRCQKALLWSKTLSPDKPKFECKIVNTILSISVILLGHLGDIRSFIFTPPTWPPIQLLHCIFKLDLTFYFIILTAKFRNQAMLFDERLNELSDMDISFERIFCLTV